MSVSDTGALLGGEFFDGGFGDETEGFFCLVVAFALVGRVLLDGVEEVAAEVADAGGGGDGGDQLGALLKEALLVVRIKLE